MADDVIAPGVGSRIATEEIGGRHFGLGKMVFGAGGEATSVSAADPLPVEQVGGSTEAKQDALLAVLADVATGADVAALIAAIADKASEAGLTAIAATLADVATGADIATVVASLEGPLDVSGPLTDAELRAAEVPVSAAALPLPAGAASAANQAAILAALGEQATDAGIAAVVAALADVATGADIATVVASLEAPLDVSGPLTDAELRAGPVAVSAAALPLPAGAATAARQDAILTALGDQATEATLAAVGAALADVATGADIATVVASLGAPLGVSGPLTDAELRAAEVPVSAAALPLPAGAATAAKQDLNTAAVERLASPHYEAVAANAAAQALGGAGAAGDQLAGLLIVPATTSPGAVTIQDGAGAAITLFAGGANSVSTLHPFGVVFGALSVTGAWRLTTGANVSAIAFGRFT